jgi:hypothetical protein
MQRRERREGLSGDVPRRPRYVRFSNIAGYDPLVAPALSAGRRGKLRGGAFIRRVLGEDAAS